MTDPDAPPATRDRLYGKYRVERTDGREKPGARYFVLNYGTDTAARDALLEYADRVKRSKPGLARDLLRKLGEVGYSADLRDRIEVTDVAETGGVQVVQTTGLPDGYSPPSASLSPPATRDELREQLASAFAATDAKGDTGERPGFGLVEITTRGPSYKPAIDAVLAVRDEELERLRSERDRYRDGLRLRRHRAEAAEAKLGEVRRYAQVLQHHHEVEAPGVAAELERILSGEGDFIAKHYNPDLESEPDG